MTTTAPSTPSPFHLSLLRPPVLQILRAYGFTTARPSVVDSVVDLASRYLLLLASTTAQYARSHSLTLSAENEVSITDLRLALTSAGALYPQISALEEGVLGHEDLRGIEGFTNWCTGPANREIRRIAGITTAPMPTATLPVSSLPTMATKPALPAVSGLQEVRADFLTTLKRKYAKSGMGEKSRFDGTVLGEDGSFTEDAENPTDIEGWEGVKGFEDWVSLMKEKNMGVQALSDGSQGTLLGDAQNGGVEDAEILGGSESSGSPLTEISGGTEGEG